MTKSYAHVSLRIRQVIEKSGLSQKAIAEAAGMKPQQLNDQLTGEVDIRTSGIEKLARALGVSPAYLIATPEERAILDDARNKHAFALRLEALKLPTSQDFQKLQADFKELASKVEAANPLSLPQSGNPEGAPARLAALVSALGEVEAASLIPIVESRLAKKAKLRRGTG